LCEGKAVKVVDHKSGAVKEENTEEFDLLVWVYSGFRLLLGVIFYTIPADFIPLSYLLLLVDGRYNRKQEESPLPEPPPPPPIT